MKITQEGKKNIEQKLSDMHDKLMELEKEKAYAYNATGDTWHDNPYFDMLRRDEEALVKQMRELEDLLHEAEIHVESNSCGEIVGIGSKIKCKVQYSFEDTQEEEMIEIVGHGESDLLAGKLAYDSPVGENLMNHVKGDIISFDIPAGRVSYEIIEFYND